MSAVRNASLAAPQEYGGKTQQQTMNHIHLSSLGSLPGLRNDHYLGNSPLARSLRGHAMPEDSVFAKAQFSAGMGKLSPLSQSAVHNVLNGSCNAEDHSLAAGALKHICRGW